MQPITTAVRGSLIFMWVLACASSASAQTAGYVAGTVFADIRQFGGTSTQTPLLGDSMSQDATGIGGSIRVGTWLHPRWSLELGADLSSKTTRSFRGPIIQVFPPVPPRELNSSTSFTSVTTMIGFHSPEGRRVRFGYRAGFSFVRQTFETDFPDFGSSFPIFDGGVGSFIEITSISAISRAASALTTTSLKSKQNAGALTLGFDAAIDITPRIAMVPEVRASSFTIGTGPAVFLIRPGVGVRWKF